MSMSLLFTSCMIIAVLYMGACTFAAARFISHTRAGTCTIDGPCSYINNLITPLHVIFPLCLVFCAFVLLDIPLATLASVDKVRKLKRSTCRLLLLTPSLLLCFFCFHLYPAFVTIQISHTAVFLLSFNYEFMSLYETTLTILHLITFLVWTMHDGPPVPIFESPGIDMCCGHMTHLFGLVSAYLYIPMLNWFLSKLLDTK